LHASEVVRLKVGDIDIAQGIVRVAQSKGRKDRNVMLSPGARSPAAMVEGASAVLGHG
jgi:site-specific recombinase XerD